MQIANEFGGNLYRNIDSMLDGIAYEFMTAGGANNPAQIDDFLRDGMTAESAARECIEGWALDHGDDEQSHMKLNGYSEADLAGAMQDFIDNRPDRDE